MAAAPARGKAVSEANLPSRPQQPFDDLPAAVAPTPFDDLPAATAPQPFDDLPAAVAPRAFDDLPAAAPPRQPSPLKLDLDLDLPSPSGPRVAPMARPPSTGFDLDLPTVGARAPGVGLPSLSARAPSPAGGVAGLPAPAHSMSTAGLPAAGRGFGEVGLPSIPAGLPEVRTSLPSRGEIELPSLGARGRASSGGFELDDGLRQEMKGRPVRVSAIYPSYIKDISPLDEAAWNAVYEAGSLATNRDIVEAALFAVSRPRHVTLASIVIDPDQGGMFPG